MALVVIRGKALTWLYLCDKCQHRLFKVEESNKEVCTLCQEKIKTPEGFILCNACAYETKMCMACGAPVEIGDDYESMREKALFGKVPHRKRKKKKARG